jgi:RNA polymerase sigma-70 factor, ECF subfamily
VLERIYEAEFEFVWNTLRRFGAVRSELEDLTHDVFIAAFPKGGAFDPSRAVRPWLCGVAFRILSDHRKKARSTREVLDEAPDTSDSALGPEESVSAQQDRRMLDQAMAALDADKRAVFVMHEINELKMPEVAEALEIPLNTAYSRLRLARGQMMETLNRLAAPRGAPL